MLAATNLLFIAIKWGLYICDWLGWFSNARQILWLRFHFTVIFAILCDFPRSDMVAFVDSIKPMAYPGSLYDSAKFKEEVYLFREKYC